MVYEHVSSAQLRRRSRGNTLVVAVAGVASILSMGALVVDAGFLYRERTQMQSAADAAALAGARELPFEALAATAAQRLALANGYDHGVDSVIVTTLRNPDGLNPGNYQVSISRSVSMFFAPVLGFENSTVAATATASIISPMPMNISGGGVYGTNGLQNLSVFGPYAYYSYGDAFSVRWLNNGNVNPTYNEHGYDFRVSIPGNYAGINGTSTVQLEIFDPDTWNVGNAIDAGAGKVDEIRSAPGGGHPQPTSIYTTTQYQLFAPSDTPNNPADDTLVATATYGPGDTGTDMKWTTPAGFQFELSAHGTGDYRLNVKTLNGSSENGFNLRAGPPRADGVAFNPHNGSQITALGNMPINFNASGTVNIELGNIPAEAGGSQIYIDKFDTDVGAKTISYYDTNGNTWPGQLSGDGTWRLDILTIPEGYSGGKLFAQYQAGAQDTSVWQMYFGGFFPGGPSMLRLVD